MTAYIKPEKRQKELKCDTRIDLEAGVDKLHEFTRANGWSASHTVWIAKSLQDRVTHSPEAIFEIV